LTARSTLHRALHLPLNSPDNLLARGLKDNLRLSRFSLMREKNLDYLSLSGSDGRIPVERELRPKAEKPAYLTSRASVKASGNKCSTEIAVPRYGAMCKSAAYATGTRVRVWRNSQAK